MPPSNTITRSFSASRKLVTSTALSLISVRNTKYAVPGASLSTILLRYSFHFGGRPKFPGVQSVRNPTRSVKIGTVTIGAGHPVAVQTMTATKTADVAATVAQIRQFEDAGADVVRIAVDSKADAAAVADI